MPAVPGQRAAELEREGPLLQCDRTGATQITGVVLDVGLGADDARRPLRCWLTTKGARSSCADFG
jgi:hypothetical protein